MKINEIIYQTPEMTEDKLLETIDKYMLLVNPQSIKRLKQLHPLEKFSKALLKEYDLIQSKASYLTKSQREQVLGFVSYCLVVMAKENGKTGNASGTIPETEVAGNNSK